MSEIAKCWSRREALLTVGGIHFMPAIVRGVTQGRSVGALVNKLPIYK